MYFVELGAFVHTIALTGSPFLMIFAAAPVELFTLPVICVRYFVPEGHFPSVFCVVYFSTAVVVPFPLFHVIFVVMLPERSFSGTVTFDDPPAFRPAGVHVTNADETVPVPLERLTVVVDWSFEHATCGAGAAPAGATNGKYQPANTHGGGEDDRANSM